MPITKAGLAVLDTLRLGREATPSDLMKDTTYSQEHIYRVIDDLRAAGLLTESRGVHNQRRVRVTGDPAIETYRKLTSKLGHVQWSEVLSPATLRVCWYLDQPRRIATIAGRLGISRQGVHKALSPIKNRAMLSPAGPEYALAEDLQPLLAFAQAMITNDHRTRVRSLASSAMVEWCDPARALVRTHEPKDTDVLRSAEDWQLTGLAKFQEFGLQFFLSGEPAFWHGPTAELTPSEVVCHMLILGSDTRRMSYTMLLIEQVGIDRDTLINTADWYGLEVEVSEVYQAIRGDFTSTSESETHLPSESEYSALKAQYEVA